MDANEYKIIKIINYGLSAVTYKIKIKNKYYALRREKILDSEFNSIIYKNLESDNLTDLFNKTSNSLIKNIYFNKFINTLNIDHFLILYNYKLGKTNFKFPLRDLNDQLNKKHYNELNKSNIFINNSDNYMHTDISVKNICYKNINKKY